MSSDGLSMTSRQITTLKGDVRTLLRTLAKLAAIEALSLFIALDTFTP
jgi:hypothetical protein